MKVFSLHIIYIFSQNKFIHFICQFFNNNHLLKLKYLYFIDQIGYINRGELCNQIGQKQQALEDYSSAIQIDPENAEFYYIRGVLNHDMGNYESALLDYDKAIELEPLDPKFYFHRGIQNNDMGNQEQALLDYNQVLLLDPTHANTYCNRGYLRTLQIGIVHKMLEIKNRQSLILIKLYSTILQVRRVTYYEMKNYVDALLDYDKAIELDATDPKIYYNRGILYQDIRNLQQALLNYNQAIHLDQRNPKFYYNRGNLYSDMGNKEQALLDYDKVIQLNPNDEITEMGSQEKALFDYNQALLLNPMDAKTYINRGILNNFLGNNQQALFDYNKSIELDPLNNLAYINRGILYDELGNKEFALIDYNNAIYLDSKNAKFYYRRGVLQDSLGNKEQALLDLTMSIQLDSKQTLAYMSRGSIYFEIGNKQLALVDYGMAIQLDPLKAINFYNRGVLQNEMGNTEQAILDFSMAIKLDPNDLRSYCNRGVIYINTGQYDLGINDYLRANDLQPENPFILQVLEQLHSLQQNQQNKTEVSQIATQQNQSVEMNLFNQEQIKDIQEIQYDIKFLKLETSSLAQHLQDQSILKNIQENVSWIEKELQTQLLDQRQEKQEEIKQIQEKIIKLRQELLSLHQIIQQQKLRNAQSQQGNDQISELQEFEEDQKIYQKAIFQNSYYYLATMQQIFSEIYLVNTDGIIESRAQEYMKIVQKVYTDQSTVEGIPLVNEKAFELINQALDQDIEYHKANRLDERLIRLNNILKFLNIFSHLDLEKEVEIASIQLAKLQQNGRKEHQNHHFNQFVEKLCKIGLHLEENNLNWKNGTLDALVILKYLDCSPSKILEAQDKRLKDIFVEAVLRSQMLQDKGQLQNQ
ncbi:unnamed protein product [Paramecium octaurelia]|uniref:Tetratricopeptide repeat protein n=1 Tax=Paramecium octaurelia TaxID=43137 RepID=A0A8S1X832_PAROT|nr:unnamed protein product [Paramecium octaurelia]